jgi:FlaA1/EpsC-like NDP-sugar epimerase
MTIPEAVQLVLQAYVMGTGEEVFCLDMGEAVKIVDLARDLIELTATPNGPTVEIRFSGSRPGEKLYEEMFFNSEQAEPTTHPKVLRSTQSQMPENIQQSLGELTKYLCDSAGVLPLLQVVGQTVTDFAPDVAMWTQEQK